MGHIGPLCEFCDSWGSVWGERYGKRENSSCVSCSNNDGIILIYILSGLILTIYITFSIYSVLTSAYV